MQNKKVVFVSIVVLIALFFVAGYVYKNNQSKNYENISKKQAFLFQRPYSVVIGNKDAKVQLVEFFDPACGTCAYYHPLVKDIMKTHKGDIKLVLRYAPFHKNSDYAIKMLEGAREQGLFLDTLEFMFATQNYWVKDHIVQPKQLWALLANVEGIDMDKLANFMSNNKTAQERIAQDLEDIKTLNIDKTPTYFVNGKPLQEFGIENLKQLINSQL